MRRESLEIFRPACPVCLNAGRQPQLLKIGEVYAEDAEHLLQAILHCPEPQCQREYPVIDGIPLLLADVRSYVADQIAAITARDDLAEPLESLLGDCCGPGSHWASDQQQLSSYGWDHYGEYDPQESGSEGTPGSLARCLARGWELASANEIPAGPMLDLGCAMGRSTLELARHSQAPVVGIDMNFAALRKALQVARSGKVVYPRRRLGMVYDRRSFDVPSETPRPVEFWLADAMSLPFASGSLALTSSFNLLDCTQSPMQMIRELGRITMPGGLAMLAAPYDWVASATPFEHWLGGHSQRSPDRGAAEPVIRRLFENPFNPNDPKWQILAEEDVPWQVRIHERSLVNYRSHLLLARRP